MKPNALSVLQHNDRAVRSRLARVGRLTSAAVVLALLGACAGIVDKPTRATQYDFGPGPVSEAQPQASTRTALVLAEVEAAGTLQGSALLYRLGYADDHQLRPYSQARWSAPPPQLVQQRLRERIGQDRIVLNPGEAAAIGRNAGAAPRVLRVELEEFSHFFRSPGDSVGLLRLRATLMENTAGGEKVLAQRNLVIQRPAPTADAPGGARALAAAVDGAADELLQWLSRQP